MAVKDRLKYNEYMRQYMIRRYHQRRQEALNLLGGQCVDCGSTENLEFDHTKAKDKSFDIGRVWSYKQETFLAEISKCVIRCRDCHANKSRKHDWNVVEHGGGVSGKNRCKCGPCRKQKALYMRNYRRKDRRKTEEGR